MSDIPYNPTDSVDFWKQRIKEAQKDEHIVYLAGESEWKNIVEQHSSIFRKEIKPTDKVLDAGCGYGRSSIFFSPDQYIGVDFSPDLIELANKKHPKYSFVCSSLDNMQFENGCFDVAIVVSIRHMVIANSGEQTWDRMEKEIKRVAKRVLILEYTDPDIYEEL